MDEDVTGQYAGLYAEFCEAVLHAGSVLKMYGMESDQFRVAEAKSAELWKSLRALQGKLAPLAQEHPASLGCETEKHSGSPQS